MDKSTLRELVLDFYTLYDPERLREGIDISGMVNWTFENGLAELNKMLYQQYGKEIDPNKRVNNNNAAGISRLSAALVNPLQFGQEEQKRQDLEFQLRDFYVRHDPSKLASLQKLVDFAMYRGVDLLNTKLQNKYGEDLNTFQQNSNNANGYGNPGGGYSMQPPAYQPQQTYGYGESRHMTEMAMPSYQDDAPTPPQYPIDESENLPPLPSVDFRPHQMTHIGRDAVPSLPQGPPPPPARDPVTSFRSVPPGPPPPPDESVAPDYAESFLPPPPPEEDFVDPNEITRELERFYGAHDPGKLDVVEALATWVRQIGRIEFNDKLLQLYGYTLDDPLPDEENQEEEELLPVDNYKSHRYENPAPAGPPPGFSPVVEENEPYTHDDGPAWEAPSPPVFNSREPNPPQPMYRSPVQQTPPQPRQRTPPQARQLTPPQQTYNPSQFHNSPPPPNFNNNFGAQNHVPAPAPMPSKQFQPMSSPPEQDNLMAALSSSNFKGSKPKPAPPAGAPTGVVLPPVGNSASKFQQPKAATPPMTSRQNSSGSFVEQAKIRAQNMQMRISAKRNDEEVPDLDQLRYSNKVERATSFTAAECKGFKLDMTGATFGACVCGRPRAAHKDVQNKIAKGSKNQRRQYSPSPAQKNNFKASKPAPVVPRPNAGGFNPPMPRPGVMGKLSIPQNRQPMGVPKPQPTYTAPVKADPSAGPGVARGAADGKACDTYRLDMTGATFGVCVCGHARAAHGKKKKNRR